MANILTKSFLGQGWNFPPCFDSATKALVLVSEEADISQSLYILFHTEPGERIMNPEYGCAMRQFMFENTVLSTLTRMQNVVKRAILRFEPRIGTVEVSPNTQQIADGVLLLEITFTISALNSRHNLVFPFYLDGASAQP